MFMTSFCKFTADRHTVSRDAGKTSSSTYRREERPSLSASESSSVDSSAGGSLARQQIEHCEKSLPPVSSDVPFWWSSWEIVTGVVLDGNSAFISYSIETIMGI